MIERVEISNFKALRDVSLDLERLTVLVGPNASGKTSVLEGFHYLFELERTPGSEGALGDKEARRSLISRESQGELTLECFSEHEVSFRMEMSQDGELLALNQMSAEVPDEDWHSLVPSVFLRLNANCLAAPSYSNRPVPQMDADGSGLASVLAHMASTQPNDVENILAALQSVVPSVQGMRFPRAKIVREETEVVKVGGKEFSRREEREYWGNSIEFDMDGASGIPGHLASEGTLLVLGLLAVLLGPNGPRLVLLDDIDRGLHPKAQRDLVTLLRKVLDQNPEMQIVATSHSPYLLDSLEPEEVRLTTLLDDGSVAVARLDEHPKFEKWKDEMSAGEFWSLVGEEWVGEAATGGKQ